MQAGWHSDPTGAFEVRWHDGETWTQHVANQGVQATSPLPDTKPTAGWYDDPHDAARLRYWDGNAWSEHRAPRPAPSPPTPPGQPGAGTVGPPSLGAPAAAPSPPRATGSWVSAPGAGYPPAAVNGDGRLSPYYRQRFQRFDAGLGVATWNWPSFLFGAIWYLTKGMWAKALLIFAVALVTGGVLAIPLWIYTGVMGNYDYWLKHRQGKQLW